MLQVSIPVSVWQCVDHVSVPFPCQRGSVSAPFLLCDLRTCRRGAVVCQALMGALPICLLAGLLQARPCFCFPCLFFAGCFCFLYRGARRWCLSAALICRKIGKHYGRAPLFPPLSVRRVDGLVPTASGHGCESGRCRPGPTHGGWHWELLLWASPPAFPPLLLSPVLSFLPSHRRCSVYQRRNVDSPSLLEENPSDERTVKRRASWWSGMIGGGFRDVRHVLLDGILPFLPRRRGRHSPRGAADRRAAYGGAPRGGHRAQGHAMLLCFARGYSCTGAMRRRRRFPPGVRATTPRRCPCTTSPHYC